MRKKVIFLCLSVLLCTSTLGFADAVDIEEKVERLMDFCTKIYCPASPLETRVNAIVDSVMNKINSIQFNVLLLLVLLL
jgi:hypothetical protein